MSRQTKSIAEFSSFNPCVAVLWAEVVDQALET